MTRRSAPLIAISCCALLLGSAAAPEALGPVSRPWTATWGLLGAQPVVKGFMDAQRLQIHCLAEPDAVDGLLDVCLGYLAGAVDAMLMGRRTWEAALANGSAGGASPRVRTYVFSRH